MYGCVLWVGIHQPLKLLPTRRRPPLLVEADGALAADLRYMVVVLRECPAATTAMTAEVAAPCGHTPARMRRRTR